MKQNEYNFILLNFNSLIPISNQSVVFPLHVNQVFFASDLKERRRKVVLWREFWRRQIIEYVQFDPIEFDMFML
jgi:hypothetical protein